MNEAFDEVRFPMHLLVDAKKSHFHVIEIGQLQTEDDQAHLIALMFNHPEHEFFYYAPVNAGIDPVMESLRGYISFGEFGLYYYAHPNFKSDYIRILPGDVAFEWEESVRDNSQQFIRYRLQLHERKKRQLAALEAHSLTSGMNESLIEVKPSFMGVSLNLLHAFKQLSAWYQGRSKSKATKDKRLRSRN